MVASNCDICDGKLVMGVGGVAICDSCGMEHSKNRMQEKIHEINGTVEVSNIAGIESFMKRGNLCLKVLNINAECAPVYIGKLCLA